MDKSFFIFNFNFQMNEELNSKEIGLEGGGEEEVMVLGLLMDRVRYSENTFIFIFIKIFFIHTNKNYIIFMSIVIKKY
jgi:hypothetical protein